jgi:hypothetical protein
MTRRIVLVLTVGAVMALMVALSGVALASHQGDCNFAGGRTTCVVVTQQTVATERPCEVGNSGRMGTQAGTVTTTTTTTTVFRGRSENIESTNTQTETGPFVATGNCRNVSGPQ